MHIERILKLLEEDKKELYSLDQNASINKLLKIECIGVQEIHEVKTFAGARICVGKEVEFNVDNVWIPLEELLYHEKIYEYSLVKNRFVETYLIKIEAYKKMLAYKLFAEKNTGIIVNNLMIRTKDWEDDLPSRRYEFRHKRYKLRELVDLSKFKRKKSKDA